MQEETVRVKVDSPRGFKIISKSEYDANPDKYEIVESKGSETDNPSVYGRGGRNPDGTFSEPTPTDIRYPNKDATEFANNHGAFVKKSAAQMRQERGLPDAPGGLHPVEAMKTEEVGKGFYSIKVGDEEIVDGMSKAEADAWNAMDDEDKKEYVAKWRKAPSASASAPFVPAGAKTKNAGKTDNVSSGNSQDNTGRVVNTTTGKPMTADSTGKSSVETKKP